MPSPAPDWIALVFVALLIGATLGWSAILLRVAVEIRPSSAAIGILWIFVAGVVGGVLASPLQISWIPFVIVAIAGFGIMRSAYRLAKTSRITPAMRSLADRVAGSASALTALLVAATVIAAGVGAVAAARQPADDAQRRAVIEVPDLTGLAQAQAEQLLHDVDLVVGDVEGAFSSTVGKGVVLSQVPAPGAQLESDAAVDLMVSLGPREDDQQDVLPDVEVRIDPTRESLVVAVMNTGRAPATGVGLVLAQSNVFVYDRVERHPTCDFEKEPVTCDIGILDVGTTATFTFGYKPGAEAWTVSATVDADEDDGDPTDNTFTYEVVAPEEEPSPSAG